MSKTIKRILFGRKKYKRLYQIEDDLIPGDIIEFKPKKRVCLYTECVVFIGEGKSVCFYKGKLYKESIRHAARGRKVRILNDVAAEKYSREALTYGEIVSRATEYLNVDEKETACYWLNCEHFAVWCRFGDRVRLLSPSEGRPLPIVTSTPCNTPDLCRHHHAPLATEEVYLMDDVDLKEVDVDMKEIDAAHAKLMAVLTDNGDVNEDHVGVEESPEDFSYDPEAIRPSYQEEKISDGLDEITKGIEELQVSFTKLNVYFKDYEALLTLTAEMDGDAIQRTASIGSSASGDNALNSLNNNDLFAQYNPSSQRASSSDLKQDAETRSRTSSNLSNGNGMKVPKEYFHVRKWIHDQREILSQLPAYRSNPEAYLRNLNKVITNSQSLSTLSQKDRSHRPSRTSLATDSVMSEDHTPLMSIADNDCNDHRHRGNPLD
ncbi:uncharacterized protein [Ptychodera flava]|uniref:uncharacterized protein n=1 Tax=Ptychodera flava TaxID=63121 RepID=UPI00396A7525